MAMTEAEIKKMKILAGHAARVFMLSKEITEVLLKHNASMEEVFMALSYVLSQVIKDRECVTAPRKE